MAERKLQPGDTIKCSDERELVELSIALNNEGIDNDFMYEKDGQKGLWLLIVDESYWQAEFGGTQ